MGGRNGISDHAGVAQSVEQLICNQPVVGSNPIASSRRNKGLREIVTLFLYLRRTDGRPGFAAVGIEPEGLWLPQRPRFVES